MGVASLWKLVEAAAKLRSLLQLAISEGFETNRHGTRTIVVGIDASIWLNEAQFVHAKGARQYQRGMNPELRTLFEKMCRLLRLPFTIVLVFDGPGRPSRKQGINVLTAEHWAEDPTKEIADVFGFGTHRAPGEAEAELAYLNSIGILDAVMTEDGDALVFGVQVVIRKPHLNGEKIKWDGDTVKIYTSTAIRSTPSVSLTQGDMVLYALLCGGDYDSVGLKGCGKVTAQKLMGTGLGDSLLNAAQSLSGDGLVSFMAGWRADLYAELLKIGQLAVAVAVDSFPKLDVLMNYAMPLTSRTLGGPPNASQSWVPRAPDLPRIAKLCKQYFRWRTCDTISKKFHTRIWDGICIRRLIEPVDEYEVLRQHIEDGVVFDNPPGMCSFLRITNARAGRLLATSIKVYSVDVTLHSLLASAASGIGEPSPQHTGHISVKIPAPIVDHRLPMLPKKILKDVELLAPPSPILQEIPPTASSCQPNSSAAGPSHISPPTPQCSIPPMGLAVSDLPPGPSYINSTGSPTSFDRSPVFLGFFDLTGGTLAHGPDIDTSARGPSFIDLTMIDDTL
ncbi:hypothetical protein K443DRAFT_94831 [Laccaria amethystina LaAM-08-1]|uniref:Exonuclease 1 n=1 Tax=Laccaria amethystina LaAM-08-1 TaxID=1095629 RepID=A0A0C9Y0U0_9AGAR|nr:hypothetical protein K443DRAFT_94831 [Laccaria amethystina LaAM-08-1]